VDLFGDLQMTIYTYNCKCRKVIILKDTFIYHNLPEIVVLNLDIKTSTCISHQLLAEAYELTDWNFGDINDS